jgi:phage baseplate assembly protein W
MVQPAFVQGTGVIGIGWPWTPTGPEFQSDIDLVESKMALVVSTHVGAHKMEPGFGADLVSLVFENILVLKSLASLSVRTALGTWLPEVSVRSIDVSEDPLVEGAVLVEIGYEYLGQAQSLGVSLGGSPGV